MTLPETLGTLGESQVLARIFPRLPAAARELLGPGDDAAVLSVPDGRVVITTDMMIHGPDFRLAWSTPHDLGWKAAASNLADVAAMGAVPTALVVALAAPADTEVAFLEAFADGLRDGCAALAPDCGVVGGDLSVSATLTIAVTAFGDLEGRAPVTRSGARPGDIVAVSGVLGAAAFGLELLFASTADASTADASTADREPDATAAAALKLEHPAAVAAQLAPHPPIADGKAAALAGATAMLDLSDGLAIDSRRLALASGVALDLSAAAVAQGFPFDAPHDARLCLDGGEDHSLLATFPAGTNLPGGFRAIGSVVDLADDGDGILVDGTPYLARSGWDPYAGWDGVAG
ncbi:MAG: thiamine-phosphate kinase [Salinibacterium sp.]|nr:thiamine-phosphate kinase [Salinibacterium sp.]